VALTPDQLAQLRRMVADLEQQFWDDEYLLASAEAFFVDEKYDLRQLAASLWDERASSAWELVATSESGSSRSAQQAFDHALAMAKRFGGDGSSGTSPETTYPRSTKMVRPTREA
jgi:hypothetical protein